MMPKALPCFFACPIVALLCFSACSIDATAQKEWYEIMVDAGSTGSRLYVMKVTMLDDGGNEVMKVNTTNCGKKKPGLSTYVKNPQDAVPPLLDLFTEAGKIVPKDRWEDTHVKILGTAGMRSIPKADQGIVWDGVKKGLISSDAYVFGKDSKRLLMRTVTGLEEGTWVMLTGNFLAGRINHNLMLTEEGVKSGMIGVLDLGGSSTQIAIPPTLRSSGVPVVGEQGDAKVRSYSAYGMEETRNRIQDHVQRTGLTSSPCDFPGYQDPRLGIPGYGNAKECRGILQEAFASAGATCKVHDLECLPGAADASDAGSLGLEFFAVSGYLFVTDYVRHWSAHIERSDTGGYGEGDLKNRLATAENRMTILELEAAADHLCAIDIGEFEKAEKDGTGPGRHQYTPQDKVPHRCLEANYVATLLRSYGFPENERFITFKDEVDGNDVEWPLGALLTMRLKPDESGHEEL